MGRIWLVFVTLLAIVCTPVGFSSYARLWKQPMQEKEPKAVQSIQTLIQRRQESGKAYLPFLEVATMHCGIYSLAAAPAIRNNLTTKTKSIMCRMEVRKSGLANRTMTREPATSFSSRHTRNISFTTSPPISICWSFSVKPRRSPSPTTSRHES